MRALVLLALFLFAACFQESDVIKRSRFMGRGKWNPGASQISGSAFIQVSGALLVIDARTGHHNDISGQGNTITVRGGAGSFGPTFNGATALTMSTGQCLTIDGSSQPVVSYRNGADKPWSGALLYRPAALPDMALFGWAITGGSGADRVHNVRGSTTFRDHQSLLRDDSGSAINVTDIDNTWFRQPQLVTVECNGTQIRFTLNGDVRAFQAQDRGILSPDTFAIWCVNALSGLGATGNGQLLALGIYDHVLTDDERNRLLATAYSLGLSVPGFPVSQTTGAVIGQSNGRGPAGTITGTPGVIGYDLNGFRINEPTSLNNGGGSTAVFNIYSEAGPWQSLGLFVAESLIQTYGFDRVGVLNAAIGGTTATDWAVSSATNTPYGAFAASVERITNETGVTLDWVVVDDGESDAVDPVEAPNFAAKWSAIADDIQATHGLIPVIWRRLAVVNPNPPVLTEWAVIQAQEDALANPALNRWVVQGVPLPNPPDVHYLEAGERQNGAAIAAVLQGLL